MGGIRERAGVLTLLVPGDPETRTGGYIYDRHILEGLRRLGWRVEVQSLDPSFPHAEPEALRHAQSVLAAIADRRIVVIDGLALGGMPSILEREANRLQLVALIHHPLALETGLDAATAARLEESERLSLSFVKRVIVTSRWTLSRLASSGVEANRIRVIQPGVDEHCRTMDRKPAENYNLLCVATLTARKGHAILFDALATLRERSWRLRCVGSTVRDPQTAAALGRQVHRLDLGDRIEFCGEVDESALRHYYEAADIFVLATYLEGYGMALADAAAYGLPVVSTCVGAIPETVPPGAGLLVPPGDSGMFAQALASLMDDPMMMNRLRENAAAARAHLPTWVGASKQFAAALEDLLPEDA